MANFTNAGYSLLSSGIASGDTSLTVTSGEGARFPSSNFYASIYDSLFPTFSIAYRAGYGEIVFVGTRTTDSFSSITRGQGGTSAIDFNTTGRTYRIENNLVAENLVGLSNKYIALVTQTSTSNPTASVIANQFIGTPVYSRSSTGVYTLVLSGVFTEKRTIFREPILSTGSCALSWSDSGTITINTYDANGALSDGILSGDMIYIEVF